MTDSIKETGLPDLYKIKTGKIRMAAKGGLLGISTLSLDQPYHPGYRIFFTVDDGTTLFCVPNTLSGTAYKALVSNMQVYFYQTGIKTIEIYASNSDTTDHSVQIYYILYADRAQL
jgi:hypothetical protein